MTKSNCPRTFWTALISTYVYNITIITDSLIDKSELINNFFRISITPYGKV